MRDFELKLVKFFRDLSTSFLDTFFQIITFLGEEYVLILIVALVYFVIDKKKGEKIAYAIFTSLALNNSLKGLIKSPRPGTYDDSIEIIREETATGFSFPSGHSQNSSVTYFSVAINFKKRIFWIIAITLTLLIAFSRVYLAAHFPTDVIIGMLLGIGCAYICSYLYDKYNNNLKQKMIMFLISYVIFLPFLFIFYRSTFHEIEIFRDFYVSYALFGGFILAVFIENKYVDFNCDNDLNIKIIRFFIGIIIIGFIQIGLKFILPENIIIIDMIRYFLISFIGLGIYPLIAKKWLF